METVIQQHPLRDAILAEVHARPYKALETPRAVLQQAFLCNPTSSAEADAEAFRQWCIHHKLPTPVSKSRHHSVFLEDVQIIWERHTELITLT